ncbi:hypothetical protein [Variovorax ginsengisoli]|uniref:DUF2188 domain-containing protein n=1 Tax=Variovorax ginsengisoli TaxID=363844 RepID=A0ABT8SBV7_9BURK|nr:hypothetical protein [Variovorax ginsengisoli]MDN8617228.1 hypothetical protein [Variovorax ginsengisoli]MDO1536398.1 hypothetical protein [Variovorax ginsengisoli]
MPTLAPKPKSAAKSRAGVTIRLASDGRFVVAQKKAPAKARSKAATLGGTLKPMSVKDATRAAEKAGILTRSGNLSAKYKK